MNNPRVDAMLQETSRQRDSYANLAVNLRGEIAVLHAEIERLKAELAAKPSATVLDIGSGKA